MFISVTPHRLTQHRLDVWIDKAVPLSVGQVLRFDLEDPFYAVVSHMSEDDRANAWLVQLDMVLGQPSLQCQFATLLTDRDVLKLIGRHKASGLGAFSLTDGEKGTLTLVQPIKQPMHRQLFSEFCQAIAKEHDHVVVLDPVGEMRRLPFDAQWQAAQDFKLSIQEIGVSQFLTLLGEKLPEPLQEEAFRILSKQVPATPDFIPFLHFLRPERIPDLPVKPVLLHVMYHFFQNHIFANQSDETFQPLSVLSEPFSRLDFSTVEDELKPLFYAHVVRSLTQAIKTDTSGESIVLVLVQPKGYLSHMTSVLSSLTTLGVNLVILPLLEAPSSLSSMAQNHLSFSPDDCAVFQGGATLGFPVHCHLSKPKEKPSAEPQGFFEDEEAASSSADYQYGGFNIPEVAPIQQAQPKTVPSKTASPELHTVSQPAPSGSVWEEVPQPEAAHWAEESPMEEEPPPFRLAPQEDFWGDQPAVVLDVDTVEETLFKAPDEFGRSDFEGLEFGVEEIITETTVSEHAVVSHTVVGQSDEPHSLSSPLAWEEEEDLSQGYDVYGEQEESQVVYREEEILLSPEPYVIQQTADPGASDTENDWGDSLVLPAYSTTPAPAPSWNPPPREPELPRQETVPVYKIQDPDQMAMGSANDFKAGERIRHDKYGEGIVHKVIPMEGSIILHILFDSVGKRLLDPSQSKVEKA